MFKNSIKLLVENYYMLTRWGKFWILVTVISLFLYDLRWLYSNIATSYSILTSPIPFAFVDPWRFWIDRVLSGLIGDGIRLIGTILVLSVLLLLWKGEPESIVNVKRKISAALICEVTYWLCILPISLIELLFIRRAQLVELAFTIQILLSASLLIILAVKIWKYKENENATLFKWAGIAAIGYLVGIWFNNVFRWFSMAQATSIGFILTGETGWGFLGTIVPLSIALILAFKSFHTLFNKCDSKRATKLAGTALIFLGLNFVVYLIYSALTNTLSFVFLVEFWPITVVGLGVGMLRGKI